MTNESNSSQDPSLDVGDESVNQPSPATNEATDVDVAETADRDADSMKAGATVSSEASTNAEIDAEAEPKAKPETDADREKREAAEEKAREILPEDLAEEDGGDNEYDDYVGNARPIEEEIDGEGAEDEENAADFDWYILKVQSNREKSICAALQRRVSVAGLDEFFREIIVPTEDVAEFKNGKRRVVKRKLFPGYIVANMALNDETWFLVRETSGIGDFTGAAGKPTPMMPEEVDRIVKAVRPDEEDDEQIKTAIPFKLADRVRIKEGTFENFEGDVEGIDEANGRVTVTINIFGRSTPVELEHWQIESV